MFAPRKCAFWLILFPLFIFSNFAFAQSIPQVARLSYLSENVSLLPAEETQWVSPSINRPLVLGDTLWTDNHARVELELGSAALRLNSFTSLKILNLDDSISQFQLSEGSIVINVRSLKPGQSYEVDTPNLAFVITKPGYYRIDALNSATTLNLKTGAGDVYGQHTDLPLKIQAQTSCTFNGVELNHPRCVAIAAMDDFDRWVLKRENRNTPKATAHKYVSKTVIGYQDLDAYGSWKSLPRHGYVWVPEDMDPDWAPYQDGYWIWLSQWGWTWVDNQPWGFAPFHYGRWIFINNHWAWVPGPANTDAWYAPALVVFLETANDIIWFPLGPGEVYIPAFRTNQAWFNQINISNTWIKNIHYYYDNPRVRINYQNLRYNQALTALSKPAFAQAQPANIAPVRIPREIINKAHLLPYAPVAPTMQSITGGKPAVIIPKMEAITTKPVIIKTPHPLQPAPFSRVKPELIKNPGKPLDIIPSQNQPMEKLLPRDNMRVIQPAEQPQQIRPLHPIPVQPPALNKPERLRPSGGMQQLQAPPFRPAPMERPQRDMQEIQRPGMRPAPIERPQRDMEEIQRPGGRPAPIERPQRDMQDIQRPGGRPVPIERPQRDMQDIQRPGVPPAPIEKPQRDMQDIQRPAVHPAPIEKPQQNMQPIQAPAVHPAPIEKPRNEMQEMQRPKVLPAQKPEQEMQQIEAPAVHPEPLEKTQRDMQQADQERKQAEQQKQQEEQQQRQQAEQQRQQQAEQQRQLAEQQRQQQAEQQRQQAEQQRQQQAEQQRQQAEQQRQQQAEQQRQQAEQQRQQQAEQQRQQAEQQREQQAEQQRQQAEQQRQQQAEQQRQQAEQQRQQQEEQQRQMQQSAPAQLQELHP